MKRKTEGFCVGDSVIVSDNGKTYSSYEVLYEQFGFSKACWHKHRVHENGTFGTIVSIKKHPIEDANVCCVLSAEGVYFMIGENGLKRRSVNYIDGVMISDEEFKKRTARPELVHRLSHEELEQRLGYKVKIIK